MTKAAAPMTKAAAESSTGPSAAPTTATKGTAAGIEIGTEARLTGWTGSATGTGKGPRAAPEGTLETGSVCRGNAGTKRRKRMSAGESPGRRAAGGGLEKTTKRMSPPLKRSTKRKSIKRIKSLGKGTGMTGKCTIVVTKNVAARSKKSFVI